MSLEQFTKIKKHLNLKQAMEAMINKQYERAIELYSSAINCDSNDWKIYIQRCNCFQKLNRLDDALKDAKTAIDLNPSQLSGYFREGSVLLEKKLFRSAEKSLRKGLECDPNDENTLFKLKETHKLFVEEFGFNSKDAEVLAQKYETCEQISDALIDGNILSALESGTESMTSAESPRRPDDLLTPKISDVEDDINISSLNGSLPDFNSLNSTYDSMSASINSMSLNDNDIRKPNTFPLFRSLISPKSSTSSPVGSSQLKREEKETPPTPPKTRMIKTKPRILIRSINT